ncbi:class I SAM-dependent methyltransferase [Anaeromyxobacter dehalogenans]|uniref:class I SAM-dependent methyltransferase n=1 Tax=Anaeromyxobacter dehalogenans TaxID=161493 RepID=UPI00059D0852|nr:class I SAM-dependent methyltransferase [Anaeromyxobacter dehalogenans]
MRLVVTTPLRPSAAEERDAVLAAARYDLPYAARGGRALTRVVAGAGAEAALVLSATRAVLVAGGAEHAWSPGMGLLRMKRVLAARASGRPAAPPDRDPFTEAAGLEPGDRVLDCTAGLGADALVAAAAVEPRGEVVGLESSRALAAWTGEGMRRLEHEPARRVEIRCADHAAFLAGAADGSFDVVVFDPMFRHARAEPGGFDVVRQLADARPLAPEALAEARRVARRWVVVKDGAPGWDLARLGLVPLPSARGAHRYYARVPAGL